jgi:hypothetical protein
MLVVMVGLAGCNDRAVDLIPVEGKVIRSDGKPWPQKGMIFFAPASAAAGFPLRGAFARFDTDGSFVAGTFEPRDGVVPGLYLVSLQCWEVEPGAGGNQSGKSCVPPKYQNATLSGLKLEVPVDTSDKIVVEFEVPAA